ncbi:MAG: DUF11 domain-containing protein [Proteobacteria bacterium]|nr:DUF11 domain-containing protein [Pseudomonadota bacterium]
MSDITEADYATLVVRIWDGSSWVDYDLLNGNSTTIDLSTSQFAGMNPLEYEVDVTFADGVSEYTTTPIINISNNMVPGQDCSYDLEIEKTANDNDVPWTIGGPGQTFTLEVANPGIDLPMGSIITVTDTLPNGLVATSASGSGWVCDPPPPAGQEVICTTTLQTHFISSTQLPGITIDVNVTGLPEGDAFVNCAQVYITGAAGNLVLLDEDCVAIPSPPLFDLEITKELVGDCLEDSACYYEITITNNGPGPFSGPINVEDTWDNTDVTFLMSGYPWNCTGGPGSPVTCDYMGPSVNLGVGDSISFLIAVNIPDDMAGETLENCAEIKWPGTGGINSDTNPENDKSCVETIIYECPPDYDLTIDKTAFDSPWTAGDQNAGGYYELVVTNNGNAINPGVGVVVTDTLPNGLNLTGVDGSPDWDCEILPPPNNPNAFTCTYIGGIIQEGQVLTTITVYAWASDDGEFKNCATVDLIGETDINPSDNTDCAVVIVDPPEGFDLEVLKELIGECKEGSVCSFKITITNNGPATFSGAIAIDDTWDLSLVSFLMGSNPWNCSGSTMAAECFGPTVTLDPNDPLNNSVSFFIGLTVPADLDEEGFVNCAAINWDNMPGFVDGDEDPTNDEFCIEVDPCECEDEEHNLAIWKISLGSDGFNGDWVAGETGIFVLNITNIGASIEAGQGETVFVVDNLPPGFTLDTPYPVNNFWDCSNSTPTQLSCQYIGPDVVAAPPNTLMNQITFHATPGEPGEFENCAEVALDGATDVAMGNNKKCIPIVVLEATPDPKHDIMLEKTSKGNQWTPGQTGAFYLDVTNLGDPIVAPVTVNVSDSLPPGFTFVPPATGGPYWNCIGLSCTYNGPPVGTNGQFPQIEIIVTAPMRPGVYENCAAAELMNAIDIDNSNNTDCIKIEVVEPQEPRHDLAIEKTSTGGAVGFGGWFPGVPGTFTLQVTNLGPALNPPGTIIVTDDDFPPWFNIISAGGNGWNCSWPNNELTCTYVGGPVGPGPNQSLPPIVVTAEPGATGEFVNCAEVALNGATDIFLPNNESCIPVVVGIPSGSGYDVAIDKVSDGSNWPAGGTAYFVLRPTNIGTTITPPGTTVVVTDPVPAGFTISSVSGGPYWNCLFSTGTPANLSCTYSGPPVGPGQPFPPIQLFVNVPERPGEYRNCAGVELTGAMDTDLSNNHSCTVVTVDVGKSFEAVRGGVVIVGVFTELTGTTVVNTGLIGEVGPVTVTGVDGGPVDSDDVDIREEDGSVTINVSTGTQVGAITIEGRDGTITLKADGARPTGPPGMTWPKDGAVNIQNGILNETFAVPATITRGEHPAGDYDIKIGDSPVDVIAIRGGEIAVTGRGIQMQESGETGISIAVKDGPRVSGQIPSWSYQLSAQAVTRLNTWAPIFFQCSGLPAREPIAIRFTPEPWQKIEPREVSLTCGEASSRIQIGQYQTSREGPQNLPAVIDRSPGR